VKLEIKIATNIIGKLILKRDKVFINGKNFSNRKRSGKGHLNKRGIKFFVQQTKI
jgi:hypothetical protein